MGNLKNLPRAYRNSQGATNRVHNVLMYVNKLIAYAKILEAVQTFYFLSVSFFQKRQKFRWWWEDSLCA